MYWLLGGCCSSFYTDQDFPPQDPPRFAGWRNVENTAIWKRCFRNLKKIQFLSPPNNAENLDGKQDLPKSSKMLQDSSLGKVGGDSANSKSGKSGGTCNHLLSFTCWQMNDRWTCMNFHLLYLMAVKHILESCPLSFARMLFQCHVTQKN